MNNSLDWCQVAVVCLKRACALLRDVFILRFHSGLKHCVIVPLMYNRDTRRTDAANGSSGSPYRLLGRVNTLLLSGKMLHAQEVWCVFLILPFIVARKTSSGIKLRLCSFSFHDSPRRECPLQLRLTGTTF